MACVSAGSTGHGMYCRCSYQTWKLAKRRFPQTRGCQGQPPGRRITRTQASSLHHRAGQLARRGRNPHPLHARSVRVLRMAKLQAYLFDKLQAPVIATMTVLSLLTAHTILCRQSSSVSSLQALRCRLARQNRRRLGREPSAFFPASLKPSRRVHGRRS
jgi:hypothetical protein